MRSALVLLMLVACGGPPAEPPAPTPPSEAAAPTSEPARPGALAPPFAPEVLREAMPVGTRIAMRSTTLGEGSTLAAWEVIRADAESVTIRFHTYGPDGTLLDGPVESSDTWASLAEHATFDAATTTRTDERITTPLGVLETWRYDARDPERPEERRLWFAPAWPGPPIRVVMLREGEEVFRMERVPAEPAP